MGVRLLTNIMDLLVIYMGRISVIPTAILERLFLSKIQSIAPSYINDKDKKRLYFISNASILLGLILFVIELFFFRFNSIISILIAIGITSASLLVNGMANSANILKRRRDLEEQAFLFLNALSINILSTQSFPKAIQVLSENETENHYLNKLQKEIIFALNIGKSEDKILDEFQHFFNDKKYQYIFRNIKNNNAFVNSDPDFLFEIKRSMGKLEDNLAIFIAVSTLFPLVLSLALSIMLPANSVSILLFPIIYAIIGSLLLKIIEIQSLGDVNGKTEV